MKRRALFTCWAVCLAFGVCGAEVPRALPPGELPRDARLGPLKDLDGYFPFLPSASRDEWAKRAEQVRMQMRVALGIWPEPTRTPLNGVVHGRIEQEDYTVEKVFFESMPGFFVTGNLYRPKGRQGPYPAVLCPHGHWEESRFRLLNDAELKKELESGGERLANGGRSMFQALGVQLARMGCVAFVYDMIGYCDAKQLSFELAHKFAKQRPEMNTTESWGLFSPQAEAHAQSIMGLQAWNSIRALDFLTSLPDVDAKRLGATGASGGGTQTMILGALDSRLTVECPAVMVSTAMQGGCTCENASLLRVGTGNIEFAALFAPKPLGMTAANDWTKEMETKGFPELKRHYAMMGAPDNVMLWPLLQFGHNYNSPSRAHIYAWFNKHFALNLSDAQLVEREYPVLTREQLTVWDAEHPAPKGGDDFERKLLRWWHDDTQAQLAKPREELAVMARTGWRAIIGLPSVSEVSRSHVRDFELRGGGKKYVAQLSLLRASDGSFELPQLAVRATETLPIGVAPKLTFKWNDRIAVWLSDRGKSGLLDDAGELRSEVCQLLDAGMLVLGVDLFGQGEFLPDGEPVVKTPVVKNPRESAAFTHGYNHSLFIRRVHDVLAVLASLLKPGQPMWPTHVVVAPDGVGPIAAVALTNARTSAALINTGGFRFGNVLDLRDPQFVAAAAKYADLPGALAVSGASKIYLFGESGEVPALLKTDAKSAPALVAPYPRPHIDFAKDNDIAAGIRWLLEQK